MHLFLRRVVHCLSCMGLIRTLLLVGFWLRSSRVQKVSVLPNPQIQIHPEFCWMYPSQPRCSCLCQGCDYRYSLHLASLFGMALVMDSCFFHRFLTTFTLSVNWLQWSCPIIFVPCSSGTLPVPREAAVTGLLVCSQPPRIRAQQLWSVLRCLVLRFPSNLKLNMLLETYQALGEINYQRDWMLFVCNILLLLLEAAWELPGSRDLGSSALLRCVTVLCSWLCCVPFMVPLCQRWWLLPCSNLFLCFSIFPELITVLSKFMYMSWNPSVPACLRCGLKCSACSKQDSSCCTLLSMPV